MDESKLSTIKQIEGFHSENGSEYVNGKVALNPKNKCEPAHLETKLDVARRQIWPSLSGRTIPNSVTRRHWPMPQQGLRLLAWPQFLQRAIVILFPCNLVANLGENGFLSRSIP